MHREIPNFLKMNDVEYKEDYCLAEISTIKIGPKAFVIAYPNSIQKLILLLNFLIDHKIRYKILGRMSNVLITDDFYDGVIVRTDRLNDFSIDHSVVIAHCGISLPYLCNVLCKAELSGIEGLSGIPGSIGGALFGNAGAFGYEIGDRVISVDCFDVKSRSIITVKADDIEFSYRHSKFKDGGLVILSARLLLKKSDYDSIKKEIDRCRRIRMQTQPTDKPSLGSAFKRLGNGLFAAKLIDDCGLKGYSVGGAQISTKHAGFIINNGEATAKDYIDLSNLVIEIVYERYKILLEKEVEII
jgi:UDP-N-acetylmuramate dehydrogenase